MSTGRHVDFGYGIWGGDFKCKLWARSGSVRERSVHVLVGDSLRTMLPQGVSMISVAVS